MDAHQLNWKIHELVDGLAARMDPAAVDEIREYVDHNEQGIAVDDLVGYLLLERTPVHVEEHTQLHELYEHFGAVPGQALPHVYGADDVLGALDVIEPADSPLRLRGVTPMRGGHGPGAGRGGATEFPTDWTEDDIREAASVVLLSARQTLLANGRTWAAGTVDRVPIGVLRSAAGELRSILPLESSGIRRTPDVADLEHPSLVELLNRTVRLGCTVALRTTTDSLPVGEVEVLTALLRAGELEEMADSLTARVVVDDEMIGMESYRGIRMMLCGFDLPIPGCEFVNDRSATLARLRVSG